MTEGELLEKPPILETQITENHTKKIEDFKMMPIEKISIYGGTQTRASTNDDAIDSYVESIEGGQSFPPVEIYFDGSKYWLADGFHRLLAYKRAGKSEVQSKIHEGSRKDALLHALGANSQNSLYRSNADKRNAVEIALEEFSEETNTFIAKVCAVSSTMVSNARKRLNELNRKDEENYKSKSTNQTKVKQVSIPGGGIERQSRGGGSKMGGSFGKAGEKADKNKKSSEEDLDDLDSISFEKLGSSETIELSPFVYADNAIKCLSKISKDHPDAKAAFARAADWLKINS